MNTIQSNNNENQKLQKTLHQIITAINRRRVVFYLILAFLAGCLCTGLLIFGQRSAIAGRLDQRYAAQYAGATEIIGRLEVELDRERELTRQLREHNNRARELTSELTGTADRNVRNLYEPQPSLLRRRFPS